MRENLQKTELSEPIDLSLWPIEAEMRELVTDDIYLDQDAVYNRLSTTLRMAEVVEKITGDFGAETASTMIETVRNQLGDDYVRLLVEPSLSTRTDSFVAFAHNLLADASNLESWDVRNRFKESLGTKTVYRAVSASQQDLENILNDGFVANFYRARPPEALLANGDGYESLEYALTDLQGRVNVHAGAFASTKDSTLISVSEYPAMAEYAASVQLQDTLTEPSNTDKKLYLLPMTVDEFFLIRYGPYLPKVIKGDGAWTSDDIEIPYNDSGVEALIEFRIPASAITREAVQEVEPKSIPQFHFVPTEAV